MRVMTNAEYLGAARAHLLEYMKAHPEPIRTPDLLKALIQQNKIPFSNGNITRHEAYSVMITSETQKRTIETTTDYQLVWHEYTQEGVRHRRHKYD